MKFTRVDPKFKSEFTRFLSKAKTAVITAHISPDEDSMASLMAVYAYVKSNFPKVKCRIINTGEPVERFSSFKFYKNIEFVPEVADAFEQADILIVLDGSQYSRFSNKPEELKKKATRVIAIDHHSSPIDEFNLSLVDSSVPANAELIFRALYKDEKVTPDIAETLLMGILGDTGNFSYIKPHQSDTLAIAKKLIDIGKIEIQTFQSRYRAMSQRVFSLLQIFIRNTAFQEVKDWPPLQNSFLNPQVKESGKYTDNEVSEASHIYMGQYLRTIAGFQWGYVITPKDDGTFRVSLRSLPGSINVRALMENMGIGGGHDRAAGGSFKDAESIEVCLSRLNEFMRANKPELS